MSERAVVVAGGDPCPADWLRQQVADAPWIVAVDRGAQYALEGGLAPDLVIGDLDSLSSAALQRLKASGVAVEVHPVDKDQSDLELALRRILRRPFKSIDVYCAFGGRLDHLITNLAVLAVPYRAGVPCRLRSPECEAFYVLTDAMIEGRAGDLVTLVPQSDTVDGITSGGLRYPLRGDTLQRGSSRGLSNVQTARLATLHVERGDLLVIVTRVEAEHAS